MTLQARSSRPVVALAPPNPPSPPLARFARAGLVSEGWYVLAASKTLKNGRITTLDIEGEHIVVYRDHDGTARAAARHCPHMGADLARARIVEAGLQCGMHGWCWDSRGEHCTTGASVGQGAPHGPVAKLRTYATHEEHGLVWAWLGDKPSVDVPRAPPGWRLARLRPQKIHAHPHIVLTNGFDMAHVGPVHGFTMTNEPEIRRTPQGIGVRVQGTLPRRLLRLAGLGGRRFDATFEMHGATISTVQIRRPAAAHVVFTCLPQRGGSRTQTLLWVPKRRGLLRALAMLWSTTLEDIPFMESTRFTGNFTAQDSVYAACVDMVESVPAWKGEHT